MLKKYNDDDDNKDGFSSEQEDKCEQIKIEETPLQITQHHNKQEVKFKLPPRPQIKDKSYSLYPDTVTGWAPKIQLPSPIPLIFDNERFDNFLKILLTANVKAKICYMGPRYQNTYYSWYQKQFVFPYSHIKGPSSIKFTNRPFSGQSQTQTDGLIFDSFFESGNLDCAIRVGERQYQLFIRVDSNTKGHLQWYNFKMKNLIKNEKYKINICNFQKNKSLYTRGMKPYVFSHKKYAETNIKWEQAGQHIHYVKKNLKCSQSLHYQTNKMYKLSFEFTTAYDNDEVQIAYCIPYTYSQLCTYLQKLQQKYQNRGIIKISKLCTSLGGLQVPLLVVQQKYQNNQSTSDEISQTRKSPQKSKLSSSTNLDQKIAKKCIIISGRSHPGQSNGSYMMEGFIDFICSNHNLAIYLRKYIIFKIIPMLNVDGVALGNYRTGISGKDFNRQFRNPDKIIFPEVYHIKKLVTENKQIFRQNLLMFLDFHGHSVKKNVFMYGPQFPIIERYYYQSRIFPKLLGNKTSMFRYYSCVFRVSEFKQTTARAVVLRKLNIPFTYTIQASNGSYYDYQNLKDVSFNINSWKQMGVQIGETLQEYLKMIIKTEQLRMQKQLAKQKKKQLHSPLLRRNHNKFKTRSISRNSNQQQNFIVPGIQDQDVRKLFQQIKIAEQKKQEQKISDDQLSEGSSDGQGAADDLSPNKVNFLYQIIKNKKNKCLSKIPSEFYLDQPKDNQNIQDNQQLLESSLISLDKNHEFKKMKDVNRKSFICKNKNNNKNSVSENKRQSAIPSKIINFSFGISSQCFSLSRRQQSFEEKISPQRTNLIEVCTGSRISQQKKNNNNRVLDLTESFRKTYVTKQKVELKDKQFAIETMYINRKPKRIDQYRNRRNSFKSQYV